MGNPRVSPSVSIPGGVTRCKKCEVRLFTIGVILIFLPQYETVHSAVASRNRLHGTKWPSTNPKMLDVDFLTAEGAQQLSDGELVLSEEQVSGGTPAVGVEVGVVREEAKEEVEDRSGSVEDSGEWTTSKQRTGLPTFLQ